MHQRWVRGVNIEWRNEMSFVWLHIVLLLHLRLQIVASGSFTSNWSTDHTALMASKKNKIIGRETSAKTWSITSRARKVRTRSANANMIHTRMMMIMFIQYKGADRTSSKCTAKKNEHKRASLRGWRIWYVWVWTRDIRGEQEDDQLWSPPPQTIRESSLTRIVIMTSIFFNKRMMKRMIQGWIRYRKRKKDHSFKSSEIKGFDTLLFRDRILFSFLDKSSLTLSSLGFSFKKHFWDFVFVDEKREERYQTGVQS